MSAASRLVIGVGNRLRGDDAAGCLVLDRLRGLPWPSFDLAESRGDVGELLDWFSRYPAVAVVDAVSGAAGGDLQRWEGDGEAPFTADGGASSHGMGLVQAIALARNLGTLPARLVVYGIPARRFALGESMSPATERAIGEAVERIQQEFAAQPRRTTAR